MLFLCHGSGDKPAVRALARRLEALGLEVWLDEEAIRVGEPFPARIEAALARASHLLAWVTQGWAASPWVERELRFFEEVHGGGEADRVVLVLPARADAVHLPARWRERHGLLVEDHSDDELDWLIACALWGLEPGPRARWPARVAQHRDERGRIPPFSSEELLDAARHALSDPVVHAPLARNAALRGLAMGASPVWAEEALGPVRSAALYVAAIQSGALPAGLLWPRLAAVVEGAAGKGRGALPDGIDEATLLQLATGSEDRAVVIAALRLLRCVGPSPAAVARLLRWLDPDHDPSARDPLASHRIRGDAAVLDAALALLLEQPGVAPTRLFLGYPALLIGDAPWWTVYLAHLLRLARAGALEVDALAERLRQAVDASETHHEQRVALCTVLDQLGALATPLELPLQELLHALRQRPREPWLSARRRVAAALLERHPHLVFLRMWPVLPSITDWDEALPAARLVGLAAQEPAQVEELLVRLALTDAPEPRVLLFEAAVGSPADLVEVEPIIRAAQAAAGRTDPLVAAAAHLLHGSALRAFADALHGPEPDVAVDAFLAGQPPASRALWPWMLARAYASPDAVEGAWDGLRACAAMAMRLLAREALSERDDPRLRALASAAPPDTVYAWIARWDQAVGLLDGFGTDLLEEAERAQAQLRWLHAGLRLLAPARTAGLEPLDDALRAWFAAVPDVALALASRPTPTWRHALSRSPAWLRLAAVLADPAVASRLDTAVYPRLGASPSNRASLLQAMARVEQADRRRDLAHRAFAIEEILEWMVARGGHPDRQELLWAQLGRSHGLRCPGTSRAEAQRRVIEALVEEYRAAADALASAARSLLPDLDLRLDLAMAAWRAEPAGAEAWLVEELRQGCRDPGAEERVAQGLSLLARGSVGDRALALLREVLDLGPAGLQPAAARALRARSRAPEDTLRLLALALRRPTALDAVEGWSLATPAPAAERR